MQINLLYNHSLPHLQLGEINHLSIQVTPKTEEKIILGVAKIKGTFLARSIPSLSLPFLQKHFANIKFTEFELSSELQHKIDPIIWATDQDIVPNYTEGKGKQPTTFPLSISLPTTIAPSMGSPEMVAMIRWKVVLEIFIKGTQDPLRATFPLHLGPPSEMAMMIRDPRSLFLKEGIIQSEHDNNNNNNINNNEEDEEFYKFSKFEIALKDEILYLLKLKYKTKPSNEDVIELSISNTINNCYTSCTAIIQQEQIIDSQTVYRNITDRLTLPFTSPSMEHRGVMMSLKNSKTTIITEYLQQKTFLVILFKSSSINSNSNSSKREQEEEEFEFKEEISIF